MQTVPLEHNYLSLIDFLLNIVDQVPISDENKFSSSVCLLNYVISFDLDEYERNDWGSAWILMTALLFEIILSIIVQE